MCLKIKRVIHNKEPRIEDFEMDNVQDWRRGRGGCKTSIDWGYSDERQKDPETVLRAFSNEISNAELNIEKFYVGELLTSKNLLFTDITVYLSFDKKKEIEIEFTTFSVYGEGKKRKVDDLRETIIPHLEFFKKNLESLKINYRQELKTYALQMLSKTLQEQEIAHSKIGARIKALKAFSLDGLKKKKVAKK